MLLDSHVLLWLLADDPKLGTRARSLIVGTTTHASSVSHAELVIKSMLGRLRIPSGFAHRLEDQGITALPLEHRHTEELRSLPELTHHDPFDRLLLAQALADGLTFLTADRRLLALDRPWIVDATQ